MLEPEERRLRRRTANKRSAQKMREQRQSELEQLRLQVERANQVTGFMMHQIAELEQQKSFLGNASKHYQKLGQTALAENHKLSAEVTRLSALAQTSSRTPATSSQPPPSNKRVCRTSHLSSDLGQPSTPFSQNSTALSSPFYQASTSFSQHSSVPFLDPDQSKTTVSQLCSAPTAQPGAPSIIFCPHISALSDTFLLSESIRTSVSQVLPDVLIDELPIMDLPALPDLSQSFSPAATHH